MQDIRAGKCQNHLERFHSPYFSKTKRKIQVFWLPLQPPESPKGHPCYLAATLRVRNITGSQTQVNVELAWGQEAHRAKGYG